MDCKSALTTSVRHRGLPDYSSHEHCKPDLAHEVQRQDVTEYPWPCISQLAKRKCGACWVDHIRRTPAHLHHEHAEGTE